MSITYEQLALYLKEIKNDKDIKGKQQAISRLVILLREREKVEITLEKEPAPISKKQLQQNYQSYFK